MKEVQQPEISIPNDDDPLKWARYARIHSEWMRSVAPQLGLDTPKLMLGDVISSIIGDGSLEEAIPTLDKETMYLVYCHTDGASIQGAQMLIDADFMNVYRLKGNYSAWEEAGRDIEI